MFTGNLLGDHYGDSLLGDSNSNYRLTGPNGQEMSLSANQMGDLFAGDDSSEGDVLDMTQGDSDDVTTLGDWAEGDYSDSLLGGFVRGLKKLPKTARRAKLAMASVPGALLSTKSMSPVVINNGFIDQAPTRAMLGGRSIIDTINRYETQYPGTTRSQTVSGTTATTQDFIFNGDGANPALPAYQGGSTLHAPFFLINIAVAFNFTIPNARIGIYAEGTNEGGTEIDQRTWSFLLAQPARTCWVAFIPFTEISSTIYPAIVNARGVAGGANESILHLTSVPQNSTIVAQLPGPDSSQYTKFKKSIGLDKPVSTLSNLLGQSQK